jgi:hypothetical protein
MSKLRESLFLPLLLAASSILASSGVQQTTSLAGDDSGKKESAAPEPPASTEANQDKDKNSGRKMHVRLGAISVGVGYTSFSGGAFAYHYGYYPYGYIYPSIFWGPFWGPYSSFYYPGYYFGFAPDAGKGELKLTVDPKNSEVFFDGAYAGTAQGLKHFWLDPGAYDLSLTAKNCEPYRRRIYVLSGKTLKLTVRLAPQKAAEVKP